MVCAFSRLRTFGCFREFSRRIDRTRLDPHIRTVDSFFLLLRLLVSFELFKISPFGPFIIGSLLLGSPTGPPFTVPYTSAIVYIL